MSLTTPAQPRSQRSYSGSSLISCSTLVYPPPVHLLPVDSMIALMDPFDDTSLEISADNAKGDAMDIASSSRASAFSHSAYTRSDFANAPLQQTPHGSGFYRRMPCKARGVPGEHVAKNAFIDIPLNAKHGTLLSCSHASCRHSGRLFRFCSVCQVPVAKVSMITVMIIVMITVLM